MTKEEARKIITSAFNGGFDENNFLIFVRNLFKEYKPSGFEPIVKHSFAPFILKYKIIGYFEDNLGNKIDILEVALNKSSTLEKARTAQRNFVAEYLKTSNKEAALVAFISPGNKDWRLSLVKLEHSLEVVNEKLKTKEEITPARRWSFLVGESEGSHTAQSRFLNLFISDNSPNLSELEFAFDIETVTNEFFDKYSELFFQLKEHLDILLKKDSNVKKDFEEKEISTIDFAKKTLGQIVFLYFLQKKGWFGVAPDKEWGEGPKKFIRELFERRRKYGKNFFNDVLEPLFYEALAQDRGKESIYPRLNNCRMPFLNGGLFEPMNGYRWETTNIVLPDELFSNNNRTKEGDTGDGILDIFDRYNFTVNENEPLEKEVAVDPEMLGKVFEKLLPVKDRKNTGAFYTPREIVHYMCQECIINYLETETNDSIPRHDLEILIYKGDRIIENDKIALEKIKEKEAKGFVYKGIYELLLPDSIRSKVVLLDSLLKNIKVADPAVGSGAFPLGMINEIVRARKVLNIYLDNNISDYKLKLHTISHSIYGVDLNAGAVEIAKLRLWLSLVVDETVPHPLPNLEHKIMQGNSLISEFEGIKLFDDSILDCAQSFENEKIEINDKISILQREYFDLHYKNKLTAIRMLEIEKEIKSLQLRLKSFAKGSVISGANNNLFGIPEKRRLAEEKTKLLHNKIEQYISESRRTHKQELKEEIDNLKWELIEITLGEQGKTEKLDEIKKLRHKNIRPFFIWKLEFSEVFKEKGGFDVVIGNPPYVGEKGNKEIFQPIAMGNLRRFYQGKMDLFYFFFHLAMELGRVNSQHAFITTNYYITALGARKLRADIKERVTIRNLINFNELRIFESALGQHNMITIFTKEQNNERLAKNCVTKRKGMANEQILNTIVFGKDNETLYFSMKQDDIFDGNENYIRLEGMRNLDRPIDNILEKIKKQGVLLGGNDGICNVNTGLFTAADKVFIKTKEEIKSDIPVLNFLEKGLLRPLFKNSDINKYSCNNISDKRVIYHYEKASYALTDIPNIFSYLLRFRDGLKNRKDNSLKGALKRGRWDVMALPKTAIDFEAAKIVTPQRSKTNTFGYNETPWYAASDVFFIMSKENSEVDLKYILALLNSKLYYQWLYYRGKRKGQTLELIAKPLSEIPIKKIPLEGQKPFIILIDKILSLASVHSCDPKNPPIEQKKLEEEIDKLVYNLYELTPEEIEVVKNESKQ